MASAVHELFLADVEDAIHSQLKALRGGSGAAAIFAQSVRPYRSTNVDLPGDDTLDQAKSMHQPDATFQHEKAEFPGVIIEVSYSQKRKFVGRLADDYLLDTDASVQVVVGLDIEYGGKRSLKATLSVWRAGIFHTADGDELRLVQEIADEVRLRFGGTLRFMILKFAGIPR